MEKSLEECLTEEFHLRKVDAGSYSPLTLAYIGDGVFDLVIRTVVVNRGNRQVNKLHRETSSLVKAGTQSEMIQALLEELTEEEVLVYKRGRNANSVTMAKNATMSDYRNATGLEALIGFLYLKGDWERIIRLTRLGLEKIGKEI